MTYACLVERPSSLRDRTSSAILDAAAVVFFRQGTAAGMDDVADAAGVARATVYRYFPNRDALLHALFDDALSEMALRLGEAEIDKVPVGEGLARTARALVAASSKYAFLAEEAKYIAAGVETGKVDECLGIPLRTLLQRGIDDGTLRRDWSATEMSRLFGGLLQVAVQMTAQDAVSVERVAAMVSTLFLEGAQTREGHQTYT
jgi:TetR/AcrR family transcriptional regulator, mexCD-oprJ operon repressor